MKEKLIKIVSLAVDLKEKGILCSVDYSPNTSTITIYVSDNYHHIRDMITCSDNFKDGSEGSYFSFGYMVGYLEGLLGGPQC